MSTLSLRNNATKYILEMIHKGEIAPGDMISESSVCELLNISRTPAREALIELTANGVLEKIPRKGYQIKEIDQKHKIDSYIVLGALDALAAKLAVRNMSDADIKKMKELIDLIDIAIKYENYGSYCELQEKFHRVYIDRCDNMELVTLLDELKSRIYRYTYYSENSKDLFGLCASVNNEHRQIVEYFIRKDGEALEDYLINTHWDTKHLDMI